MATSVGMVNLGCAKNQVDGEVLMAALQKAGFELRDDAALADVAIVNTCGFIEDAKKESIEEILELAKLKKEGQIKKIVVTGCLAERYREEVAKELPEADAVIGIGANPDIADIIARVAAGDHVESYPPQGSPAHLRRARAHNPQLFCVPQNRRGLRQPLFLLRYPAHPRRLPQPHDGGYSCGSGKACG